MTAPFIQSCVLVVNRHTRVTDEQADPLVVGSFVNSRLAHAWFDLHSVEIDDGDYEWVSAQVLPIHSQFNDTWKQ